MTEDEIKKLVHELTYENLIILATCVGYLKLQAQSPDRSEEASEKQEN